MSLPAFLPVDSPPRSPHVKRAAFRSYFSNMSDLASPSTSRPSRSSLRPSRREVLLCLLTLSFSYLLFSPQPASDPIRPATASRGIRIPALSDFFTTESACPPLPPSSRETTFGESTRMIGPNPAIVREADEFSRNRNGKPWDQGEEAEDDELESVATVLTGHQPGWTLMERLYIFNGSFYVIT